MKTIFYAWQSDIDRHTNDYVIRLAIRTACKALSAQLSRRVELDHDTKGIPGSPAILDSIFKKIHACDCMIADITPVGVTPRNKKLMNPNVQLEIGYGLSILGDFRLITVMNEAHGSIGDLPFDLAHRRGPIMYNLQEGAAKTDVTMVSKGLATKLTAAVGDVLRKAPPKTKLPQAQDVDTMLDLSSLVTDEFYRFLLTQDVRAPFPVRLQESLDEVASAGQAPGLRFSDDELDEAAQAFFAALGQAARLLGNGTDECPNPVLVRVPDQNRALQCNDANKVAADAWKLFVDVARRRGVPLRSQLVRSH